MNSQKEVSSQNLFVFGCIIYYLTSGIKLIFQKFFYWYPLDGEVFGSRLFELSVGILPYPLTFLITDLISEIYGKKLQTV